MMAISLLILQLRAVVFVHFSPVTGDMAIHGTYLELGANLFRG